MSQMKVTILMDVPDDIDLKDHLANVMLLLSLKHMRIRQCVIESAEGVIDMMSQMRGDIT